MTMAAFILHLNRTFHLHFDNILRLAFVVYEASHVFLSLTLSSSVTSGVQVL